MAFGLAVALSAATVALATTATERARLERLNIEESALSAQQSRNMNQLSRLLSVLARLRRDPPPALLVSPRDARDAVRAAILVKAMTPALHRRAVVYAEAAGEIARQRRLAAVESEALFTSESARAEGLRGPLALSVPAPSSRKAAQSPPPALLTPAAGPISQRFGDALPGGGRANGLTISTLRGAGVQSPGDGVVQYAGPVKGWGVIVILRLAGGYHLVLGGLDRVSVDVGQSVAAGAPVGWMPDGRQSAAELYLEVREHGAPVNPTRWMSVKTGEATGWHEFGSGVRRKGA